MLVNSKVSRPLVNLPFGSSRICIFQWFSYGLLKEFWSKSMQICLESSWSIFIWNHEEIPSKINGNLFGELLDNFPMEYSRNSFQNQWKLVWRALGQFPNGILKEFLSKSTEIGLERILMEFLSKSMAINLESSW